MAAKHYKVVRESREHDKFFSNFPEYAGYRVYLVESQGNNSGYGYGYKVQNLLVTREKFLAGQSVHIDEGTELLPVRDSSTVHLGGNKVLVYRPERDLEDHFEIVSFANDGNAIERFGGRDFNRGEYNLYNAKRGSRNGYNDVLVRIFAKAIYGKGMTIPANEISGLGTRSAQEKPHYIHNMESKAYIDRVWRAVRNASGATNVPH